MQEKQRTGILKKDFLGGGANMINKFLKCFLETNANFKCALFHPSVF